MAFLGIETYRSIGIEICQKAADMLPERCEKFDQLAAPTARGLSLEAAMAILRPYPERERLERRMAALAVPEEMLEQAINILVAAGIMASPR